MGDGNSEGPSTKTGGNRGWEAGMRGGCPRNRAKSWMGDGNSEGLSTKTGKIVDGRRGCEGAVHENGQNRGWEAGMRGGCPRKRAKSWMRGGNSRGHPRKRAKSWMGGRNARSRPRKGAKSWMGDGNSEGPSTKTGKIVDERRECEGAVHEKGGNRGW